MTRCAQGWSPLLADTWPEVTAAVQRGEAPDGFWSRALWKVRDKLLRSFPHHFGERSVLTLGDLFEPLV
jgi:hypothetical protein